MCRRNIRLYWCSHPRERDGKLVRSQQDDPLTEYEDPQPNPDQPFRPFCQQFPSNKFTINASCDDCESRGIGIRKKVRPSDPPVTIYPEYIPGSEEQYNDELFEGHGRPLDGAHQPGMPIVGEAQYPPGLFGDHRPGVADSYDQPTHHRASGRNRQGTRTPRSKRKRKRDSKEKPRCIIL